MKNRPADAAPSLVSDWTRELWEAEAKYTATVGSRLKFGLPLAPVKQKGRKVKTKPKAARKA